MLQKGMGVLTPTKIVADRYLAMLKVRGRGGGRTKLLGTLKTSAAQISSIIRQYDEFRLVKLFLEVLTSLNSSIRLG